MIKENSNRRKKNVQVKQGGIYRSDNKNRESGWLTHNRSSLKNRKKNKIKKNWA